jgi:Tol biopolymer transport system component
LLTDIADTFAYFPDETIKPYGININNGELYTLDGKIGFPSNRVLDIRDLPKQPGEETVWGVASPESSVFAFETTRSDKKTHLIYLAIGNTIRQLTFGDISCYIDRFSETGRYLTVVYGTGPTWILVFDLRTNHIFRVERPDNDKPIIDYLTSFSPDDRMMLFIRSDKKYRWERDYFGDIWLLRFN